MPRQGRGLHRRGNKNKNNNKIYYSPHLINPAIHLSAKARWLFPPTTILRFLSVPVRLSIRRWLSLTISLSLNNQHTISVLYYILLHESAFIVYCNNNTYSPLVWTWTRRQWANHSTARAFFGPVSVNTSTLYYIYIYVLTTCVCVRALHYNTTYCYNIILRWRWYVCDMKWTTAVTIHKRDDDIISSIMYYNTPKRSRRGNRSFRV